MLTRVALKRGVWVGNVEFGSETRRVGRKCGVWVGIAAREHAVYTMAIAAKAKRMPMAQPARTSLRKCSPRMTRDIAMLAAQKINPALSVG